MGLIRGKSWWWRFFKEELFNLHAAIKGDIILSYGPQSLIINIDPGINPLYVYINCMDEDVPVCVGGMSLVAAKLNEDHTFTITANIASNTCNVGWLIEYEPILIK